MDQLDAGARGQRRRLGAAEHLRGLDGEERPQALSAAEHGVAHRLHQAGRPGNLAGANLGAEALDEEGLDLLGDLRQPVGKVGCGRVRLDRTGLCLR